VNTRESQSDPIVGVLAEELAAALCQESATDEFMRVIMSSRLYKEFESRSSQLSQALERETATADVLRTISRSTVDLPTVLNALVASALRLCNSSYGGISLREGDRLRVAAVVGGSPEWVPRLGRELNIDRSTISGRVALSGQLEIIPDIELDLEYEEHSRIRFSHTRALMGVPLVREGNVGGVLYVCRPEPGTFSESQRELVQTFADQAVIAIENVRLFDELQARTSELTESLQQQTATADVLKVISRSAFDLDAVFQILLDSAARLCAADRGVISRRDGDVLRIVAGYQVTPEHFEYEQLHPHPIGRGTLHGRAALEATTVHVPDVLLDPEYERPEAAITGRFRAVVAVPIRREGDVVGVFGLGKEAPGPFTPRQVELVETFADQAAIAIENVRLFNEVQERTRELQESLDYQTATSEVLNVISRSPAELQPVLDVIIETAVKLCEADGGTIARQKGEHFIRSGQYGFSEQFRELMVRAPVQMTRGTITGRTLLEGKVVHVLDAKSDPEYSWSEALALEEIRTGLGVPLLRQGTPIGTIALVRRTVRPFTEKQIELVTTFADQAVIAIENARLFNEVQTRNRELTEALEQQTATGSILRAIASSPTNTQPVLNAVAQSAAQLCEAYDAAIFLREENALVRKAHCGPIPIDFTSWPIGRDWVTGRAFVDRTPVHVPDLLKAIDEYPAGQAMAVRLRHRTILAVPLMRKEEAIGALVIRRTEVRPFTEKQIELVSTFADQAAIAIENVRLFDEVQSRTRDLTEALEYQTATSDVLNVISRSPSEAQPVLDSIVSTAGRLCEADYAFVFMRKEDGKYHLQAGHLVEPEFLNFLQARPIVSDRGTTTGRAALEKRTIHIPDAAADPDYAWSEWIEISGSRTFLGVPLLREGDPVGVIAAARKRVEPFTDRQIQLITTFADQAVIAIENARLFQEVQTRNRELTEALEQQTATAAILGAIASSPTDVQPVLEAVAESAARLCDAFDAIIFLKDGDELAVGAHHGPIPMDWTRREIGRHWVTGRAVVDRVPIHIHDLTEVPEEFPLSQADAFRQGHRTILATPLLRENEAIGALVIRRTEVRPFSDKQIGLVTSFANQAVIAIQNVRLFEEVQTRNRDLRVALEQQTATSELLKVIGRSTFDLQPVFDRLAESAVRLCEAERAVVFRYNGEFLRAVAWHNPSAELRDFLAANLIRLGRHTGAARAGLERKTIHIHDLRKDPEYSFVAAQIDPVRTILAVPMLRGDELLGVTVIYRLEVRPFADTHVALMETFSDQAVIAIENARLFDEVQARTAELTEALQQQTATAEVLKIISRSAFDLKSVLQTLVESAARLCDAEKATITREIDGKFYRAEAYGFSPEFMEYVRATPVEIDKGSASGRALLEGKVVHIADVEKDPDFTFIDAKRLGGFRTILGVPMLREGTAIGVLALTRAEVRPFTDKQIELVSTFADQAAIAIENVRLFESVEARTRDLMRSLEDLRTAQDRLIQTEKLASLGQLTAGIAHEIKNPLNFVNNFSAMSVELLGELRELIENSGVDERRRGEVDELLAMLKGNLEKVNQHGRRADSIVKNMLLHSRQGSGEHRLANINAILEESLNLAYHGARAERQGFNIALERSFDPEAGEVDLYPQEITRVLLNLISNGFYATIERRAEANGGYEPTLTAATRSLGDRVEIRIRDNGTGIPREVREKIFLPFFTTKPAGEGTGLGLSLSYDIIVKQHAGSIEVETQRGAFTEFRIVLPRAAASLGKPREKS
jgi:two-component system, NtrC family, sensor kinase